MHEIDIPQAIILRGVTRRGARHITVLPSLISD
ncbi:uncharacterized protein METZ01_LOCUS192107 [marine metagenome]|uniref:Uncharacterized protein n=1 Tax=marine metagenome TaxID=408172 RepID=A0A382DNP1_9ZZZZ